MQKFVLYRQYGSTGPGWFGAAPYGEQWVLLGDDGKPESVSQPMGSMHRLAPFSTADGAIDAAFGRHGRDGNPVAMKTIPVPENATDAAIRSSRPTWRVGDRQFELCGDLLEEFILFDDDKVAQVYPNSLVPLAGSGITVSEYADLCAREGKPVDEYIMLGHRLYDLYGIAKEEDARRRAARMARRAKQVATPRH